VPDAGVASADAEAESSDAEVASRDTGAASAATLAAECFAAGSPYHSGNESFAPEDFCTLFAAICLPEYFISSEMALASPATCAATFASLSIDAQDCRTDHLCNAAEPGSENPHCYHAQGWASATTMPGGPCQ
jgi:hypothetical protein